MIIKFPLLLSIHIRDSLRSSSVWELIKIVSVVEVIASSHHLVELMVVLNARGQEGVEFKEFVSGNLLVLLVVVDRVVMELEGFLKVSEGIL